MQADSLGRQEVPGLELEVLVPVPLTSATQRSATFVIRSCCCQPQSIQHSFSKVLFALFQKHAMEQQSLSSASEYEPSSEEEQEAARAPQGPSRGAGSAGRKRAATGGAAAAPKRARVAVQPKLTDLLRTASKVSRLEWVFRAAPNNIDGPHVWPAT